MRITNNMLSQNLLRNLEAAQGRMDNLQNQLGSGQRITKPSDDPVGIENALRLKTTISSVDQWKNNASQALSIMNTTDSTLGDMNSMLQRVRELTVQAANGTNTVESRQAIGQEVDQIKNQLQMLAKTQIGTKYIFGGTQTDQPPITIDPITGTTNWQGNVQDIAYPVGTNLNMPISVNGNTLLFNPMDGKSTGLFTTLDNLSNLLKDPTKTGEDISNTLPNIDGNIDNVLALRAGLGARTNRMTAISEQLDSTSTNLVQNLSDIQDADMAKTITDFQNQQNVYKAALSVGAQIIQPSLVDFLK
ncbi:flagellar hook-associated protein FlgL [Desulfitobacterium metallireducens]|uniref:Flagellar hook-associated protein FlgL n=1 Tax=Desulfitobacterium metallireducens DSM 15288 TaxID=871968 RepID=W0EAB9_9FIRM|nr:flagellar hook-associated protein FlgL [Desulfitobacterium metallireducens]AHF07810.1 flagellar hook-associated protein FlgL [Desulfitobacterium metallireducens DSM 15288]